RAAGRRLRSRLAGGDAGPDPGVHRAGVRRPDQDRRVLQPERGRRMAAVAAAVPGRTPGHEQRARLPAVRHQPVPAFPAGPLRRQHRPPAAAGALALRSGRIGHARLPETAAGAVAKPDATAPPHAVATRKPTAQPAGMARTVISSRSWYSWRARMVSGLPACAANRSDRKSVV